MSTPGWLKTKAELVAELAERLEINLKLAEYIYELEDQLDRLRDDIRSLEHNSHEHRD